MSLELNGTFKCDQVSVFWTNSTAVFYIEQGDFFNQCALFSRVFASYLQHISDIEHVLFGLHM